ncbi:MAG: GIY-YIG nuclease family protein [Zoogloea sp.]|nr:GIY-YIG nuclease family protein [Zoogloea sp.]
MRRPSGLQRPRAVPAAVYLIHRTDRRRFKLGWSLDPLQRALRLPEFPRGALDLRGSYALWLASRQRAEEIERAMHKSLAPYRVSPGHCGDGHSEWFVPAALPSAIRLLQQMPQDAATSTPQRVGLKPLLEDASVVAAIEPDQTPQEVWYAVEDLWLRLAQEMPVHTECDGPTWRVTVRRFRHAFRWDTADLRRRALDIDSFAWRTDGQNGSFVRLIAYEGDDLVYTVATLSSVVRWPQGEDVGWQVRALLGRLRSHDAEGPSAMFV